MERSAPHLLRGFIDSAEVLFTDWGFLANVQVMAETPSDSGMVGSSALHSNTPLAEQLMVASPISSMTIRTDGDFRQQCQFLIRVS